MSLSGEVFSGGATTSQHIEAQDDDHFENTTFKLKRTRSMGLLDEFIPDKLKEQDGNSEANSAPSTTTTSSGNLAAMAAMASQSNSPFVDESPSSQHYEATETISNNSDANATQSSVAPSPPSPVNSPSPASSPALDLKSPELLPHDDTDLTAEPSRHVDYLSHQWDVSDIWKSWRYVISKRRDVANAARLENASWRTWAQRRSNLKTISPEVVNWSKDSDVTWLYGPILKDDDHVNNENHDSDAIETTATSSVAGDISIAKKCSSKNGPKPILKKRTMEQLMISHSNLLKLQLATQIHQKKREQKLKQQEELKRQHQLNHPDEYFDPEALLNKLNSQYKNTTPTHNSSVAKLQNLLKTSNSSSTASLKDLIKDEAVVVPSSEQISQDQNQEDGNVSGDIGSKAERHIHFNDEVMQCIAVDVYSDDDQRFNSGEDYDSDDDDDDDDDDDYYDEYEPSNDSLAQSHLYEGDDESIEEEEDDDEDASEDEEEDDEGGFFLNVKSNSNAPLILGQHSSGSTSTPVAPSLSRHTDITDDTASISTTNSKSYKTIQLLPSTSINYGSDESSDEANPYTSSLSHNVNNEISRGYDYYYDYNTVYTCNPNNSVYASYQSPDVVDVPENLDMGSNFDYEFIENNDSIPMVDTTFENNSTINNMPISYSLPSSPLSVAISGGGSKNSGVTANSPNFPIVNVNPNSQSQSQTKPKASPFQLSDSEDDSDNDSDDSNDGISGLSIGTRRSSQALAELVFQSSLTTSSQENPVPQHFPDTKEAEPVDEHISSINPRYSSTSISKQPTSSSSLSQLFFGGAGGFSSTDKELSKLFLGGSTSSDEKITTDSNPEFIQTPNRDYTPSPDNNTLTRTLSNTSKKSSPLPPQTTSENAFRGDGQHVPPQQLQQLQPRRGLLFDEGDSEDSEDEGMVIGKREDKIHGQGYNALSQVADRNGIHSPSPQFGNDNLYHQHQDHDREHEENHKNLVGQARGLAKHFFG